MDRRKIPREAATTAKPTARSLRDIARRGKCNAELRAECLEICRPCPIPHICADPPHDVYGCPVRVVLDLCMFRILDRVLPD